MGELINGRTPEEIKLALRCCRSPMGFSCRDCPYNGTCLEHEPEVDALAYIEHLEAQQQEWISVEERLPEHKTAVLGYGLRHRAYPDTDPFPACHVVYTRGEDEGWFTFWNNEYVAVTHWMPLPSVEELK